MANVISMADFRKTAVALGETVVVSSQSEDGDQEEFDKAQAIVIDAMQDAMKKIKDEGLSMQDMAFACVGDGVVGLLHFGYSVEEINDWIKDIFGEDDEEGETDEAS